MSERSGYSTWWLRLPLHPSCPAPQWFDSWTAALGSEWLSPDLLQWNNPLWRNTVQGNWTANNWGCCSVLCFGFHYEVVLWLCTWIQRAFIKFWKLHGCFPRKNTVWASQHDRHPEESTLLHQWQTHMSKIVVIFCTRLSQLRNIKHHFKWMWFVTLRFDCVLLSKKRKNYDTVQWAERFGWFSDCHECTLCPLWWELSRSCPWDDTVQTNTNDELKQPKQNILILGSVESF